MKSNAIDRRNFLYALGASAIAASPLLPGVRRANAREGATDTLPGDSAGNFYPFHTRPASAIDFGLSPEQEQRARELHESLYLFDGEMETTWFGALYDNILKGGGGGGGGQFHGGRHGPGVGSGGARGTS